LPPALEDVSLAQDSVADIGHVIFHSKAGGFWPVRRGTQRALTTATSGRLLGTGD